MHAESRSRWLAEADATGICPLCLAADEFEADYLTGFCQELDESPGASSEFVAARGFCFDHTRKLEWALGRAHRSIEESLGLYVSVLDALLADLGQLEEDGWLHAAACPLCVRRDQHLAVCAHHLMDELSGVGRTLPASLAGGGLCIGHFVMTWEISAEDAARGALRDLQLSETAGLIRRIRAVLDGHSLTDEDGRRQAIATCKKAMHAVSGWTGARR
jgi:hypothetical protein